MSIENGKSRMLNVRLEKKNFAHLQRKAKKNSANPHNHVGTELNILVTKDRVDDEAKKASK